MSSVPRAVTPTAETMPLESVALARALRERSAEPGVTDRLGEVCAHARALHIAVMREPYLQLLLDGKKTIESRFSVNRVVPFEAVQVGDVLALKAQSGPIVGLAVVEHVAFYELDPPTWRVLRHQFAQPLCAEDDEFWELRAKARYASLMTVRHPHHIDPVRVDKRDRRGWVRLNGRPAQQQLAL